MDELAEVRAHIKAVHFVLDSFLWHKDEQERLDFFRENVDSVPHVGIYFRYPEDQLRVTEARLQEEKARLQEREARLERLKESSAQRSGRSIMLFVFVDFNLSFCR